VPEVAGGGPVGPRRLLWRMADTIQNRSPAAPAPINSQPQPGRPSESSASVWLFAAAAAAAPAAAALPWFVLVGFVLAGGVVWVLMTVFVCVGAVTVFVGVVTVLVWVTVFVGAAVVVGAAAAAELVDFVFVSAARATPQSATVASAVAPATRMTRLGRLRAVWFGRVLFMAGTVAAADIGCIAPIG
jgi:hypothetical protein